MAITQRLARLTSAQLDSCRKSLTEIDALCTFRMLSERDYLDLNWYGTVLELVATTSDIKPSSRAVLELSLAGDQEINPAYRDLPDTIWEHPVASLSAAQVHQMAEGLNRLKHAGFPSKDEIDAHYRSNPDSGAQMRDPHLHLPLQFLALRDFYIEAARRDLSVAMWWD